MVGAFTPGARASSCCGALQQYQTLIYAVLMIVVMLLLPNGIISFPSFHGGCPRRQPRRRADEPAQRQEPDQRFGGLVGGQRHQLRVEDGEILSVIGPNGAGKSTLFKLIASFLKPTTGQVLFDGERHHRAAAARDGAQLGVVRTFQETTIFKEMTALENVRGGAPSAAARRPSATSLRDARRARDEARFRDSAAEILQILGLGHVMHERARGNLPHG